jgi:hypothetical protein
MTTVKREPRLRKPRGRPFKSGNPGRPPGARNKTTQVIEQLVEGQAELLVQRALELALGGDVTCLRMMLDRVCPIRKGRPVNVDMPPIKSSQDLFAAIASIWTAIGDGRITPDEAGALSIVVDRSIQAIELHAITERIAALEEARDNRQLFSACELDYGQSPTSDLYGPFVDLVERLPDKWSSWLSSELRSKREVVKIADGSNVPSQLVPSQLACDNFLLFSREDWVFT